MCLFEFFVVWLFFYFKYNILCNYFVLKDGASLVAQMVTNLPAMQETWALSLGWADPLEEGGATHPSILAGESPWTEEPGGLRSMGSQRVGHSWVIKHTKDGEGWNYA